MYLGKRDDHGIVLFRNKQKGTWGPDLVRSAIGLNFRKQKMCGCEERSLIPIERSLSRSSVAAQSYLSHAELQIRRSNEDNSKIIFLISQQKRML